MARVFVRYYLRLKAFLLFEVESFPEGVGEIKFLPGEEFDFDGLFGLIFRAEVLDDLVRFAAHVTEAGCLGVDGAAEFEAFLDGCGGHVEELG